MEVAGYNRDKVNAIGDTINNTYATLVKGLADKIQAGLVDPMSTKWYAPEAVDEFKDIQKAVKKMGEAMYDAYKAYRDWVQQMGENWAANTKGKKPSLKNPGKKSIDINVSKIQKENGGNVTLDEKGAQAVAATMKQLHSDMLALVRAEHGKLEASSAFIGHGQAAAATACFVKVADAIGVLFNLMETLGDRLNEYANKYKTVGEGIRDQFKSAKIDVQQ